MQISPASFRLASAAALLSIALDGCASSSASDHAMHGAGIGSDARGGMQGQQGTSMDMQARCDMHKQQMAGKSPQECQAMMDEHTGPCRRRCAVACDR